MKFKFTIDKKKYTADIPTSWEEISVKQFQALALADHQQDELAALTQVKAEDWQRLWSEISVDKARPLINAISFLRTPPNLDKLPIPPEILLCNRVVKPLRKVDRLKSQAYHNILLEAKDKEPADIIQRIHVIAGHGLAQSWTRDKYSEEIAKKLANELLSMSITAVYPIAHFFWYDAQISALGGHRSFTGRKIRKLKRKRNRRARQLWISSGLST